MTETKPQITEDITPYRQPMVTSLAIFMGFFLNFLASWAVNDEGHPALTSLGDKIVAGTILVSIFGMGYVLYRLLDNRIPAGGVGRHYQHTFRIYIGVIVIAFVGLALALIGF